MVPAEGFEPPTTRLRSGCSTAELRRLKTAPLISMRATIGKQYSLYRPINGTACATAANHRARVAPTFRALGRRQGPGHPAHARAESLVRAVFACPVALIVALCVEGPQTLFAAWLPASRA